MKNFTRYVFAFAVAGAVMASCDVNKPDIFDDANAFVAFDNETMSIDEVMDGTSTLTVPVTLASVAGIEESVSFRVVEGTAKEGVNYELLTTSGVLNFNAENRTQNIEITILHDGENTGNLTFTIEFVNTGSVNQGAENTCTVTIMDADHPFAAMFGTYTFTGIDGFSGSEISWTAQISADDSDTHRLWIQNIAALDGSGIENDAIYYGTIDDEMTTLTIPIGQTATFAAMSLDFALYGMNNDDTTTETGSIVATITKDGDTVTGIDFGDEYGFAVICITEGDYYDGWFGAIYPGITATKN